MSSLDASSRTALMLIDLQRSFLDRSGGNYFEASASIVGNLQRLLAAAREKQRTVVHVAERHRPNVKDFESTKLPEHCVAGEPDAEFYPGFGPDSEREFLLEKRRVSAFFGTDLDLLLREQGIERIVVAGVKTNVCVRATVIDAFSLGYRCLVVRDAVRSNRAHLSDASLEDIDRYFGWVVSMDDALEALGR